MCVVDRHPSIGLEVPTPTEASVMVTPTRRGRGGSRRRRIGKNSRSWFRDAGRERWTEQSSPENAAAGLPSTLPDSATYPFILCKEFLNRFYNSLLTRGIDFSVENVEKELINFCVDAKGKENRLCYYLGATKDAATKILGEVTRPMSAHMPIVKICERLKKMDSQICELKYEKKLDLASVDLWKMRVAELKQILHSWGEECKACAEKNDYVNLIKELAPKYSEIHPQTEL